MVRKQKTPAIYCDSCRKEITRPEDGIIRWIWIEGEGRLDRKKFAIVHRGQCDDRLDSGSRSGFLQLEDIQERFQDHVNDEVLRIRDGLSYDDDLDGLAWVLSRVNSTHTLEELRTMFYEAYASSDAVLSRHILSIERRLDKISLNLHLQPSDYDKALVDIRSLLLAKFGPSSSIMGQMEAMEKQLAKLQKGFPLQSKSEMLSKFISAIEEYSRSAVAAKEFEALLGLQASELVVSRSPGRSMAKVETAGGTIMGRPKAFIAHGGQSGRLRKLCDFLKALGVEPVVAEWSASEGRWTEAHVDKLMRDSDCYIVLAEDGGIIDVKTGAKHPRLNVVDELARSRKKRPRRTILLLEKGVDLPSNVKGIVYERFTKRNMDKAFVKVANELSAFGLIRAIKG